MVSSVQNSIDHCRLQSNNWKDVLSIIELHASHFAEADNETSAYYLVCTADAIFESKGALYEAIRCCKRAFDLDSAFGESQICLARLLLEVGRDKCDIMKTEPQSRRKCRTISDEDTYRDSYLIEFESIITKLSSVEDGELYSAVQRMDQHLRHTLLSAMSILSPTSLEEVCNKVIQATMLSSTGGADGELAFISSRLVLITTQKLLKGISVQGLTTALLANGEGAITEYKCWCLLDAVVSRAVITELLGEVDEARSEYLSIADTFLPLLCSAPAKCAVPPAAKAVILNALSRLVLLSASEGSIADTLKYLRVCVADLPQLQNATQDTADTINSLTSGSSSVNSDNITTFSSSGRTISHLLPRRLQVGLVFYTALLFVNLARDTAAGDTRSVFGIAIAMLHNNAVTSAIEVALRLFKLAVHTGLKGFDSTTVFSGSGPDNSDCSVDCGHRSLTAFLPSVESDPIYVAEFPCSSVAAALAVAITRAILRDEISLPDMRELLESGLSFDATAEADSLWFLAEANWQSKRYLEAVEALKQSYHACITKYKPATALSRHPTLMKSSTLNVFYSWLGCTTVPSRSPDLPIRRITELYLYSALNRPAKAVTFLALAIRDFYSDNTGHKILSAFGSLDMLRHSSADYGRKMIFNGIEMHFAEKYKFDLKSPAISTDFITSLGHASSALDFIALLGECHLRVACYCSTDASTSAVLEAERHAHLVTAAKIFSSIHAHTLQLQLPSSQLGSVVFKLAVVLAELGRVQQAAFLVHETLSSLLDRPDAGLLHVLALLSVCPSVRLEGIRTDGEAVNAAIDMCERATAIQTDDPNIMITLAGLCLSAGEAAKAAEVADKAFHFLVHQEHYLHGMVFGVTSPAPHFGTDGVDDAFTTSPLSKGLANSRNNTVCGPSGTSSSPLPTPNEAAEGRGALYRRLLQARYANPQRVQFLSDSLCDIAMIFARTKKFDQAKGSLHLAWQVLFVLRDDDEKFDFLHLSGGSSNDSYQAQYCADILSKLPTLLGWRLHNGMGWGAERYLRAQANVIYTAACILQLEAYDQHLSFSRELLLTAIALCPDHVPSLIALSTIEAEAGDKILKDDVWTDKPSACSETLNALNRNITRSATEDVWAHASAGDSYARSALEVNDRDSGAWAALGRSLALTSSPGAADALMNAIELQQHQSIHPFHCLLRNGYFRKDASAIMF